MDTLSPSQLAWIADRYRELDAVQDMAGMMALQLEWIGHNDIRADDTVESLRVMLSDWIENAA